MAALGPGQILDGKYAIKRVLGEGGMGVVYEAHHTGLDQPVAIKLMLPELLTEQNLVARFEREARAAAKLKSRYVARVFDVDVTPEGLPYIVMELLDGHDLAHEIAEAKQLPVGQAVHVLLQVCVAIDAAHRAGIVHRDLKPANVFLAHEGDKVVAKVLDFGISKDLVANTRLTSENGVVGTVLYMSPEQVRNEAVDNRTDIWSLGALLYEALAGVPPFDGSVTQVAAAIVSQQPRSLRSLRPDLPAGLGSVIKRMLAKDPKERYPDVNAVMHALAPFAPTQDLGPYLEAVTSVRERVPSDPRVDVADTLDAADRVAAPAVGTNAGLSSERLLPRRSPRGRLLAGAFMVAIPIAAFAFVLTRPTTDTAKDTARSETSAMASTSAAPAASTAAASTPPETTPTTELAPTAAASSPALDAGVKTAAPASSSIKTKRAPKGTPPARPAAPTPPPAPPTKGPAAPFHL